MKNILLIILICFVFNFSYSNSNNYPRPSIQYLISSIQYPAPNSHEFYVSITDIRYNANNESLEITFKIFTDDFEKALETVNGERIFIGTDKEHKETDAFIEKYLKKSFSVSVDNRGYDLVYIGKEVEIDMTYCYIEVLGVNNIEEIEVTSTLLTDVFDGQKNIVHIKKGKIKRSMLLSKGRESDVVSFK